MNSNEQAKLTQWLTQGELEELKENEELVKQLKNSIDPKNKTRKQNAYNRISSLKELPETRKSKKNMEDEEDEGLSKEDLETVKRAREELEQIKNSMNQKDIDKRKEIRAHIAIFTNKTRKRSQNYNKKERNANNKYYNNLTNAHKAYFAPKYSVEANSQRVINTAGKRVTHNIITKESRRMRNASYNHQKNLHKAQINNHKKNIAKLENRANRYGSISSSPPSKPSMTNRFFGLFRTTKPANSGLSNLSKTMKNRMVESGTSVNKTKKNLETKKKLLSISQYSHNNINRRKNSYKKWNAANNAQIKGLEEDDVRVSKEFLDGQAKRQYNFNHGMNAFK